MEEDENVALFDLDSTLADYTRAMQRDYNAIKAPKEDPYQDYRKDAPPHILKRIDLIRNQPGWWRNLEAYKPGFDILNIAKKIGFTIHILTKAPRSTPNAWTEKVEWVQHHVPEAIITLTQDKGKVYGKVLVDDHIPYITSWLSHRKRGLVIMPAHPWNDGFTHPQVIRYDGKNLSLVQKALELAKKRKGKEPLNLSNL